MASTSGGSSNTGAFGAKPMFCCSKYRYNSFRIQIVPFFPTLGLGFPCAHLMVRLQTHPSLRLAVVPMAPLP